MRIAIFAETYYPFISGVVTHVEVLKMGLEAAGHEVMIVTANTDTREHYCKDNILYCPSRPLKKIYGYGLANPFSRERLEAVRAFNPDILHTHTEFTIGMFALYCARALKKPLVHTLHTMYDDYLFYLFPKQTLKLATPLAHAYFRAIAGMAAEIIGPSSKVADYVHDNLGLRRRVHIIPNTVDLSAFMADNIPAGKTAEVKKRLGIQPGDVPLCFVGRLGKEKSIDVLIDFFAKSFAGEERFKLLVIGDGPEMGALKAQAARLGVERQVLILGRVEHEELPPYYLSCELFTTASTSEMNSISLLEANACGLYAVQRHDPKNSAQILAGVNGEEFTTPAEFEAAVRAHAALSQEQRSLRRAAVCAHSRRYGCAQFTAKVLGVYGLARKRHALRAEARRRAAMRR